LSHAAETTLQNVISKATELEIKRSQLASDFASRQSEVNKLKTSILEKQTVIQELQTSLSGQTQKATGLSKTLEDLTKKLADVQNLDPAKLANVISQLDKGGQTLLSKIDETLSKIDGILINSDTTNHEVDILRRQTIDLLSEMDTKVSILKVYRIKSQFGDYYEGVEGEPKLGSAFEPCRQKPSRQWRNRCWACYVVDV
jgi:chromosome segregation ATPase